MTQYRWLDTEGVLGYTDQNLVGLKKHICKLPKTWRFRRKLTEGGSRLFTSVNLILLQTN